MCGDRFWKRVVVFCLAFGVSVFVSDSYVQKDENVKVISEIKLKDCVFADEYLKYRTLPRNEFETGVIVPLQKDEKNSTGTLQENAKTEDKKEEKVVPLDTPNMPEIPNESPFAPTKNVEEYKILLHKEKCQVSDGRK